MSWKAEVLDDEAKRRVDQVFAVIYEVTGFRKDQLRASHGSHARARARAVCAYMLSSMVLLRNENVALLMAYDSCATVSNAFNRMFTMIEGGDRCTAEWLDRSIRLLRERYAWARGEAA